MDSLGREKPKLGSLVEMESKSICISRTEKKLDKRLGSDENVVETNTGML